MQVPEVLNTLLSHRAARALHRSFRKSFRVACVLTRGSEGAAGSRGGCATVRDVTYERVVTPGSHMTLLS